MDESMKKFFEEREKKEKEFEERTEPIIDQVIKLLVSKEISHSDAHHILQTAESRIKQRALV
jgi:hypothetical protein